MRDKILRAIVTAAHGLAMWAALSLAFQPAVAFADSSGPDLGAVTTSGPFYTTGTNRPISLDTSGNLRVNCLVGCSAGSGTGANNSDAVASVGTGLGSTVSYNYGYNGTTWDRLEVDGSKNLKVNCTVGCAGGSSSNASDGVATSSTNGQNLSWGYLWNGTTWDRQPGSAANGTTVNLTKVNGTTLLAGTGAQGAGSPRVTVATDTATVAGSASIPAGTNIMGKVGIDQTTPGTTNGVTIAPSAAAGVGQTPVVTGSGASSQVLKASAGNLYGVYATNLTGTAGFLVVLNATSAPADGAITPLACVPLTANGVASINYLPGPPAVYSTGITAVVTSAATCFTKTTGTITAFIAGQVS
jgi:hypothetical protein